MADPISILGAAIGVTSLVIQVVDECIQGYHFYCMVVAMPKNYQYLTIRMQMEQRRFLTFSQEAGLLWAERRICNALQINQSLLLAILAEVKLAFEETQNRLGKYADYTPKEVKRIQGEPSIGLVDILYFPDLQPSDQSNEKTGSNRKDFRHLRRWREKFASAGGNLRDIALDTRRLTFTFVDQPVIEGLIARLQELNSFLIALLDDSQTERLRITVNNSYREILQVKEDVQTLQRLFEALGSSGSTNASRADRGKTLNSDWTAMVQNETDMQIQQQAYLRKLTEIKLQYKLAVSTGSAKLVVGMQPLNWKLFDSVIALTAKRSSARYQGQDIWIEWQDTDTIVMENPKIKEDLLKLLTDLVCYQKPERFRSPPCIGYVRHAPVGSAAAQYGVVFSNHQNRPHTKLRSLTELLRDPTPSLSERMKLCEALAECVFEFHTVGWLHKGIRSDNIVFFVENTKAADLTSPILLGFQLSRPDILDEMTIKPKFIASEEIYRHPQAQFSAIGSRYRRSYDLYSLAIVLIEIALWKPIQEVIGVEDMSQVKSRFLQGMRERLTEEVQYLQKVACAAGDPFKSVVISCLLADNIERPMDQDESDTFVEIRLQRTISRDVVGQLRRLAHVLSDE